MARLTALARRWWCGIRLFRQLLNWRAVYQAYFGRQTMPELRLRNGVVLHHTHRDAPVYLLLDVFADGVYRRHLSKSRSGTVIDIGANIGATAIDLGYRQSDLHLHCYEPNPENLAVLRRNIEDNFLRERVQIFLEAVGSGLGSLRLWVNGPSLASTAYADNPPFPGCAPIDVKVVGLNKCLERVEKQPVILLKIDAEGAEADISEGIDPSELRDVCNVALEYHNDLCPRADERCEAVLIQAGYKCERVPAREADRGMIYGWREL